MIEPHDKIAWCDRSKYWFSTKSIVTDVTAHWYQWEKIHLHHTCRGFNCHNWFSTPSTCREWLKSSWGKLFLLHICYYRGVMHSITAALLIHSIKSASARLTYKLNFRTTFVLSIISRITMNIKIRICMDALLNLIDKYSHYDRD